MAAQPAILALQIQRLMVDDAKKQQLLEEIKSLDAQKLSLLSDIIREHDEEAIKTLDEKAEEQQAVKDRLLKLSGEDSEKSLSANEQAEFLQNFQQIFSDQNKFNQLLAICDDLLLSKLEKLFTKILIDQSEEQQKIARLFHEARLQRAAVDQENQKDQAMTYANLIIAKKAKIHEMDEVIAEVEQALKTGK